MKPEVLLLDVDGVMTTGQFFYSEEGKIMKIFGPDDNDGLSLLKPFIEIRFVTGDRKGFPITKKRIADDMKYPLDLVSTIKRIEWIKERWDPQKVIYVGDGIFDHYVFAGVGYSIATQNAHELAKQNADYVTSCSGADRAVAEACLHIMEKFFEPFNPDALPGAGTDLSGEWTA